MRANRTSIATAACRRVQRWWRARVDRATYRSLLRIVHDAERLTAVECLRFISSGEACLLEADRTVDAVVRLRLQGERFPPRLVYKILIRPSKVGSIAYFDGALLGTVGSDSS